MAETKPTERAKRAEPTPPTPHQLRENAKQLPERDPVERAHKDALLAETAQDEAKAKVKIVDASRDAADTPSGHALKKTAGVTNDLERGEKYSQHKSARRWGVVQADES